MITTNIMNVGILTYHEGLNHGAYLQAFATMRVLQGMGHEVEIINYKNKTHRYMEDVRPWLKYRRPVRFSDRIKKQVAFKRDHKSLSLSPYTTDPDVVKKRHYDVVVVGSDVVWNYKIFGYDDLYFGGANADRIISYAPSFGWVNAEDQIPPEVTEGMRRYDAMSVRDENTQEIVKNLMGLEAQMVLDPTLIYDFEEDARASQRLPKPYLLVYAYTATSATVATVRKYAEERGLETIATGYRQDWCKRNLMGVGPLEWLTMFNKAHSVVTSTFHGMVFALLNQKQFYYIANSKARNRVISLLNTCGIVQTLNTAEDGTLIWFDPDYDEVMPRLKTAAEASRTWLLKNLAG